MPNLIKKYYYCIIFFFIGGFLISLLAYNVMGRAAGFENISIISLIPGFCVGSISAVTISFLVIRNRHTLLDRLAAEQRISSELKSEIAERKRAEEALRASEAQLRLVTDNIPVLVAYIDRDCIIRFANKPFADYFALPMDEIVGMHLRDVRGREAFEESLPLIARTLAGEVTSNDGVRASADGRRRYFRATRVPHFDSNDWVQGYFIIFLDLTEHREREEQLHQAQKMEVVGQLTGGIAHDFNNILTVVLGNLELLEMRASDPEDTKLIARSMNASRRAADLTHQLLAYSRRQALEPKHVNINEHVRRMASLLQRALGETISLRTESEGDLWTCEADPAQLESAIMNLCLNARDAMPAGGSLVIECANAQLDGSEQVGHGEAAVGDYVVLSVADSGVGMSPEVLARAFEPFFTTKGVGEGSGLGLSMIYGFAKQSGGHVTAHSEEGSGTKISLFLPRAEEEPRSEQPRPDSEIPRGGGETVLVIEDDPNVRNLVVDMLEELGYNAVDVPDAAAAANALAHGKPIDLVLSDMVLSGGKSGPEFAEQACATRPGLKVIFMSGYSQDVARGIAPLGPDPVLLKKPFERQQLARVVRDALA